MYAYVHSVRMWDIILGDSKSNTVNTTILVGQINFTIQSQDNNYKSQYMNTRFTEDDL